ncbi:hypothetical protein ACLSU7_15520 [Bdellovibrio sp. HCB185ZH]|uniref:hypothetical protein n=1 Tax=Bdellovibrio sp. HCB185ZH TaxID=3394235 RepID=UPI0039A44955
MKNLGWALLLAMTFNLTACLENQGSVEFGSAGSGSNTNSDFSVVTEPSPTPTVEPSPSATPAPPTGEAAVFQINNGAKLTDSANLELSFISVFSAAYLKLSTGADCSNGSYEPFVDSKMYQSAATNQNVALSVMYKDYDGRTSECLNASILIDEAGPEIVFAKYPTSTVEEGSDVEIVFTVSDVGSGIDKVTCSFAGVSKACAAGTNTIKIPSMVSGTYTLAVTAADKLAHSSAKSITFDVSSKYKSLVQNVQVTPNKKVDLLIVIDNSGSMEYEQKNMASRVKNLLSVIKGLDWQIAVTTTDPRDVTLGDGRLVQLTGKKGQYILTSAMADAEAQTLLGATLQRSEVGSGDEQAIYVTYRAIERSLSQTGGNVNFVRPDAQLAVLTISDEDESKNGTKNDPQSLLNFISQTYGGQKAFSFHSIITRPGDTACKSTNGYAYGYRYEQISKLTGGVIGDVCAADYAAQVSGIADGVRKTLKTFTLTCAPVVDSVRSISVLKDGQPYAGAYTVSGVNMVFSADLPQGQYQVYYSCVK